jgi:MoaA/NifB/PqqE/SkfB family radical SAM enzyme
VETNPELKEFEMSNWGEIFLNPQILDIFEFAYNKGIKLYCGNGTNFNYVPDSVLEGLVKYRIEYLNLSIDGTSQDVYVKYRRNGNYDRVISNIEKLNVFKKIYNSPYPKLSWQFIIFGHNEHQIASAKSECERLGMVFNPKMNHSNFSPICDQEYVKLVTGLDYSSREEFQRKTKKTYKSPCYQCLFSPQINWNGDVLGCCVNKWGAFGNVSHNTLREIMEGKKYQAMLNLLTGKSIDESIDLPCHECPNLKMVKESPISIEGLIEYRSFIHPALR